MISCGDPNQKNPSTLIGILNHKQTVNTKEIFYLGSKSEKSFWHWQNPLTQTDINFIRDFLLGSKIIEIFQALIRILSHKQSVNTEFIGDFPLGPKIRKFLQALIRILQHRQTVNTLWDFLIGFKIRKIFQVLIRTLNHKQTVNT